MRFKKLHILLYSILFVALSVNANAQAEKECFEKASRGVFKFNQGFDKAILKPTAKLYNKLPEPVRNGAGNFTSNIATLLSIPNHLLQGEIKSAGHATGSFLINTTVGVLGLANPAGAIGLSNQKEDLGQTLGSYGVGGGCYFVLPILGPTTVRDSVGMFADIFIDPVYQITHNTEFNAGIGNDNYSEHNYYYYRGTNGVDFRAKNIDSFDSLERNSIDLYASVKSLYLQNRLRKINNSKSTVETQDDSDWEEIDTN